MPFPMVDYDRFGQMIQGAAGAASKAAEEQAAADKQKAADSASAYQTQLDAQQKVSDQFAPVMNQIQGMISQTQSDVANQKVDFNRFWSTQSAGQKVMSAIGLALSGLGSGLTGQPNMAAQMINDAIKRDVEQQTVDLGRKNNLLSGLMQQYGNLQNAQSVAYARIGAATAAQIGLAGARAGSAEAQARADALKAQIQQSTISPLLSLMQQKQQMAFNLYMMNSMNQGQDGYLPSDTQLPPPSELSMKGRAEVVKANNDTTVRIPASLSPTGAPALTRVPEKVRDETQTALNSIDQVSRNLAAMKQLVDEHPIQAGSAIPTKVKSDLEVLYSGIMTEMNKTLKLNRFTSGEADLFAGMLPTPTEIIAPNGAGIEKLIAAQAQMNRIGGGILSGFGVRAPRGLARATPAGSFGRVPGM